MNKYIVAVADLAEGRNEVFVVDAIDTVDAVLSGVQKYYSKATEETQKNVGDWLNSIWNDLATLEEAIDELMQGDLLISEPRKLAQ